MATIVAARPIAPRGAPVRKPAAEPTARAPRPMVRRSAARAGGGAMPRRAGLILVALTCAMAALGATGAQARSHRGAQRAGRHDVIANLFEWNWRSVRRECRRVLGPAGDGGGQGAPPQDSLSRSGATPAHPWWEGYQPGGYPLTSRVGKQPQVPRLVARR